MLNFDEMSFAANSDPRCALSIVLDCSDSMTQVFPGESRSAMESLNGGLDILVSEVHKDALARRRIEISFVPYGTEIADPTDFTTIDNIVLPTLSPMGITNTGAALTKALDSVDARKKVYNENGIPYYQPMIILISDGLSMDDLSPASTRIKELEANKRLSFFGIGIEGADLAQMSTIGSRPALGLKGMKFDELFQWLSASVAGVSSSQPGDAVSLPSPAGWAEL